MSTQNTVLVAGVHGVNGRAAAKHWASLPNNHAQALRRLMAKLVEVNTCPDFIEDRGHTYGHELSDDDKRAMIEYMKYF